MSGNLNSGNSHLRGGRFIKYSSSSCVWSSSSCESGQFGSRELFDSGCDFFIFNDTLKLFA